MFSKKKSLEDILVKKVMNQVKEILDKNQFKYIEFKVPFNFKDGVVVKSFFIRNNILLDEYYYKVDGKVKDEDDIAKYEQLYHHRDIVKTAFNEAHKQKLDLYGLKQGLNYYG